MLHTMILHWVGEKGSFSIESLRYFKTANCLAFNGVHEENVGLSRLFVGDEAESLPTRVDGGDLCSDFDGNRDGDRNGGGEDGEEEKGPSAFGGAGGKTCLELRVSGDGARDGANSTYAKFQSCM